MNLVGFAYIAFQFAVYCWCRFWGFIDTITNKQCQLQVLGATKRGQQLWMNVGCKAI